MSIQTLNRAPQPDDFSEPTGRFNAASRPWSADNHRAAHGFPHDHTEVFRVDREARLINGMGTVLRAEVDYDLPDYKTPADPRNALENAGVHPDDVPNKSDPDMLLTPDEVRLLGRSSDEQNRVTYFHNPDQIRRARGLAGVLRHTAERFPTVQSRPARHSRPDDLFEQTPLPPTDDTVLRVYHGRHHRE